MDEYATLIIAFSSLLLSCLSITTMFGIESTWVLGDNFSAAKSQTKNETITAVPL
jgi:hypothetical protein